MSCFRLLLTFLALAITVAICGHDSIVMAGTDGFEPIPEQELKMTAEPLAPGAPAIILLRKVDRDDNARRENHYVRIKILTEEGRKYADVEIQFFKDDGSNIKNIKARTVQPDGSATNFEGKPYDKSIVKAKGLKYMAKTFTLPNVQVGSIIEYSYMRELPEEFLTDSRWVLNDELFTRHAKFSLKPYSNLSSRLGVRWSWHGLPPGAEPPKEGKDKFVRLEVDNMPAFPTEDFMPPEIELKARVDFTYGTDFETDAEKYWKKKSKLYSEQIESFIGKQKAMQKAVEQIVSPNDPPEVKVQKIYQRVQSMRNTSYEVRKTEQERERAKEKSAENVEEIWKKGYGDGASLTWLFLALVRAAGIEAYPVLISNRSNYFFRPASMDANKLVTNVVLVRINGKDLYCDPGYAFTPFGQLFWTETMVPGLRLEKDAGTWIDTPRPESSTSRIERRATLSLSDTGDLEGKLSVTFTGLESMQRRLDERNEDEAARKKFLEEEAKEYIPAASEVELTNKPDWKSSSTPLVAEFDVNIPGWASRAGRRSLVPVGVFSGNEKHVFDHAERVHPIYLTFPFENVDDLTITLPEGWQVGTLPREQEENKNVVSYSLKVENNKQTLHVTRKLRLDFLLIEAKYYPALRDFFHAVRKTDEQQIVLEPGGKIAGQ
jgi:uncharacterized protein DUF3857/uncharacterized protein DUF3858/transglutaminase superfamily protein